MIIAASQAGARPQPIAFCNHLKVAAVGALAAIGLSSAAVAQQSSGQKPSMSAQQHQQMISGGMQNGQTMPMMAEPQMRQRMMQMMKGCNQMMQQMENRPRASAAPKS